MGDANSHLSLWHCAIMRVEFFLFPSDNHKSQKTAGTHKPLRFQF